MKNNYKVEDWNGVHIYVPKEEDYIRSIHDTLDFLDKKLNGNLYRSMKLDGYSIIFVNKWGEGSKKIFKSLYKNIQLHGVHVDKDGAENSIYESFSFDGNIINNKFICIKKRNEKAMQSTLIHEIGHYIDNYLGKENRLSVEKNLCDSDNETKNKETFAECFCDYFCEEYEKEYGTKLKYNKSYYKSKNKHANKIKRIVNDSIDKFKVNEKGEAK